MGDGDGHDLVGALLVRGSHVAEAGLVAIIRKVTPSSISYYKGHHVALACSQCGRKFKEEDRYVRNGENTRSIKALRCMKCAREVGLI
jgi:DNA-directed RNA polymerase subunit RPC12/RpoP